MNVISKFNPGVVSFDLRQDGEWLVATRGCEIYEMKPNNVYKLLVQGHYAGEL